MALRATIPENSLPNRGRVAPFQYVYGTKMQDMVDVQNMDTSALRRWKAQQAQIAAAQKNGTYIPYGSTVTHKNGYDVITTGDKTRLMPWTQAPEPGSYFGKYFFSNTPQWVTRAMAQKQKDYIQKHWDTINKSDSFWVSFRQYGLPIVLAAVGGAALAGDGAAASTATAADSAAASSSMAPIVDLSTQASAADAAYALSVAPPIVSAAAPIVEGGAAGSGVTISSGATGTIMGGAATAAAPSIAGATAPAAGAGSSFLSALSTGAKAVTQVGAVVGAGATLDKAITGNKSNAPSPAQAAPVTQANTRTPAPTPSTGQNPAEQVNQALSQIPSLTVPQVNIPAPASQPSVMPKSGPDWFTMAGIAAMAFMVWKGSH